MYKRMLRWIDRAIGYSVPFTKQSAYNYVKNQLCCSVAGDRFHNRRIDVNCFECSHSSAMTEPAVCEREILEAQSLEPHKSLGHESQISLINNVTDANHVTLSSLSYDMCNKTQSSFLVVCPCGHVTHNFLACDQLSQCIVNRLFEDCPIVARTGTAQLDQWNKYNKIVVGHSYPFAVVINICRDDSLGADVTSVSVKMFACSNDNRVHYTLVCDFQYDCPDRSDESFCIHPRCDGFACTNGNASRRLSAVMAFPIVETARMK
jgi:hypothetical protein